MIIYNTDGKLLSSFMNGVVKVQFMKNHLVVTVDTEHEIVKVIRNEGIELKKLVKNSNRVYHVLMNYDGEILRVFNEKNIKAVDNQIVIGDDKIIDVNTFKIVFQNNGENKSIANTGNEIYFINKSHILDLYNNKMYKDVVVNNLIVHFDVLILEFKYENKSLILNVNTSEYIEIGPIRNILKEDTQGRHTLKIELQDNSRYILDTEFNLVKL